MSAWTKKLIAYNFIQLFEQNRLQTKSYNFTPKKREKKKEKEKYFNSKTYKIGLFIQGFDCTIFNLKNKSN